jgi:hypothetical protein
MHGKASFLLEGSTRRSNMGDMEPTTVASRTLNIRINRPYQDVYDFLVIPENFPKWALGLGALTETAGDNEWLVASPGGPARVRFTEQNRFGVLDHYVMPESGVEVYVPMRVIANGAGSEVSLVLFRAPDMSDEQYAEDAGLMEKDLATLKQLLEA